MYFYNTVVLGDWEGDEYTVEVERERVAQINSLLIAAADRFVIHPHQNFWWYTKDGRVSGADELFEWYKAHPKPRRLEREA